MNSDMIGFLSLFGGVDQVAALLALVGGSVALGVLGTRLRKKNLPGRRNGGSKVVFTKFDPANMSDPLAQIEAVSKCSFERVRLLNKEEARLLPVLERIVRDVGRGHRGSAPSGGVGSG
jgi:hypothetical protein